MVMFFPITLFFLITEFEEGTVTNWGVFLERVTAVDGWKNVTNEVQIHDMSLTSVCSCMRWCSRC